MDAKTSNLFIFLWLFFIVIWLSPKNVDARTKPKIEELENMLEIDGSNAGNWPELEPNGEKNPFYIMIFPKNSNDFFKFEPKLIPNHTEDELVKFSFQYWTGKNELFRFLNPNDSAKSFTLESGKKFENSQVNKKLTKGDLKNMSVRPAFNDEEHRLFLRDVKINDYFDFLMNFENQKNDGIKYTLKNDANKKAMLQKVFKQEQFDKLHIKTNLPANSELYLLIEKDKHIMKLPFEIFKEIKEGVYLQDILAMDPNGGFMLIVKTINDQKGDEQGDQYVEFTYTASKPFNPIKPATKVEQDWVYYYPETDFYDLELQAAKPESKFFACDSMANCFKYKTNDNKIFKLDKDKFKDSLIIKRLASNVEDADYNAQVDSFDVKTLRKLQNQIKVEGSKTYEPQLEIATKSLKLTIEPENPDTPIKLTIPYIDLRVFEPTIDISQTQSVESISILRPGGSEKIMQEKIKELFGNTIKLSEFLNPDIKDFFGDVKYEFEIKISGKIDIIVKLNDNQATEEPQLVCMPDLTNGQTSCRSKWVKAPYSPKKRWNFGTCTFEFKEKASKEEPITIKRQIISYNGKILSETIPKVEENQKNFVDSVEEEVEGPIKVFYWIDYPENQAILNFQPSLNDKQLDEPFKNKGPVNRIYDPKYYEISDQTCPKGFGWVESLERCMLSDKSHPSLNEECDDKIGCTNIFNKPLMNMPIYINKDHLEIPGIKSFNNLKIQEMYIPTNKENRLILKKPSSMMKDTDDQSEFCIKFNHFGYKTKLLAGIESMPGYDFEFNDDQFSMKNNNPYTEDSICASQLFFPPKDTIVLKFVDPNQDSKLSEKSVADFDVMSESLVQPINGLMRDDSTKQAFLLDPYNMDFIETEAGIKFSFSNAQADFAVQKGQESFQRILTTKFIHMPIGNPTANKDKKLKIHIGLKYSGDFLDYDSDVWIQFRPQSKSKYNIKKWQLEAMNYLEYEPIKQDLNVTEFQVQFVFQIKNLAEMKEQMKQKNKDKIEFLIEELSINDPCVGETNSLTDFCSGLKDACRRTFNPKFGHICDCTSEKYRSGDECEIVDYCRKENKIEFCQQKSGKCENDQQIKTWKCTCPEGQIWIPLGEFCLDKIKLDCTGGQIIKVTDDQSSCVCPDGQILIGDGKEKKCEEYDVCNSVHRKAKNLPEKPCTDMHAECKKTSSTEYQCVCTGDMMNQGGNFSSNAWCFDRLCELNLKCQQKCSLKTIGKTECLCYDNYNQIQGKDGDHNCQIKDEFKSKEKDCLPSQNIDKLSIFERAYLGKDNKCSCKLNGTEFNPTSKKCESNGKDPVKKDLHCDHIKILNDGKIELVGPEGKKYDHVYGECRYEDCSEPDHITFVQDEENSQCLSVCDRSVFIGCNDGFARCNSQKVMDKIRAIKKTPEKEKPIFFKGKDKVISDSKDLCDCIDGFIPDSTGKCILDTKLNMFEVDVQFLPVINGKTTIENFLKQILQSFIKERQKGNGNTGEDPKVKVNCDDKSKCKVYMETNTMKPKLVEDYLNDHCVDESYLKTSNQSKNCVYLLKNLKDTKIVLLALTRTKNGSIESKFNRCFSEPCQNFKHTSCAMSNQNPLEFKCDCDGFYKNGQQKIMDLPEIHQCELKTCEENNIHCKDQTAKCEMFEPYFGYGIAEVMAKRFKKTINSKSYFGSFGKFREEPFPACLCPNGKVVINIEEICPK